MLVNSDDFFLMYDNYLRRLPNSTNTKVCFQKILYNRKRFTLLLVFQRQRKEDILETISLNHAE